jgi:hypothetical protein
MGKNQNTWSHRTKIIFRETKIIFHPLGSLAGFPARVIVLWHENVRGTRNASLAGYRCNDHSRKALLLWMWFLNVWDNVPMYLKDVCQQYFTCMCFLGFIRDNKTFIACGFRKYGNLFTHEYHIPIGRCPQGIWYSWVTDYRLMHALFHIKTVIIPRDRYRPEGFSPTVDIGRGMITVLIWKKACINLFITYFNIELTRTKLTSHTDTKLMDMSDRNRLRVLLPKRQQIFPRWTSTFSKRQ